MIRHTTLLIDHVVIRFYMKHISCIIIYWIKVSQIVRLCYIKETDYRNRDGVDAAASFWNHRRQIQSVFIDLKKIQSKLQQHNFVSYMYITIIKNNIYQQLFCSNLIFYIRGRALSVCLLVQFCLAILQSASVQFGLTFNRSCKITKTSVFLFLDYLF